jgi:hypothetical protein
VPGVSNGLLAVMAFVERRIVHHHDAVCWEFWEQILDHPNIEDIGIHVGLEQADGQQKFADQSADGICAASGLPVMRTKTALSFEAVAVGAGHIVGKTAFVDVNNGALLDFIGRNLLTKDVPCAFVGPWMAQRFFCV